MEWLDPILDYFRKDPIRVLTVIGGSGGLFYWFDRYRNRPHLDVRILREITLSSARVNLSFEVENLGLIPTSLEPKIALSGYTPMKKKRQFILDISSQDRSLPPRSPKQLEATIESPEAIIGALWFKTYVFTPTQGRRRRVRLRHAALKPANVALSWLRFYYELIQFYFFGKIDARTI